MILPKTLKFNIPTSTPPILSLPGEDDILKVELENGITILSRSNFNSPSVFIQGYIEAGSILDPDEKLGLANFTASALMRGAAGRDFQEIYNTLESAGASLSFSSGTLATSFGGKALAEDLKLILELLSQTLTQPEFPDQQVKRLRTQIQTSLSLRAQDTSAMAALKFDSLLFAGHPYERPEDGYQETVAAISIDDLIKFHQLAYGPKGMVLVIVGGLDPQAAVDLAAEVLSPWANPIQIELPEMQPIKPMETVKREHVTIPGKSQADVILGVTAPERRSKEFLPLALANDILGQFGLYGRIGESVREKAGLAYYAYSSLTAGTGPGAWYASAGVDPMNVNETIKLIEAEFGRITKEKVDEDELADSKTNFIGRLPLGLESNGGVAAAIINLIRYNLGMDYYRHYPGLIQAVTSEDILKVSQKYLQLNQLAIATAGPAE